MKYRAVYELQSSVWAVYEVQSGVWITERCMKYRVVYAVQSGVWAVYEVQSGGGGRGEGLKSVNIPQSAGAVRATLWGVLAA